MNATAKEFTLLGSIRLYLAGGAGENRGVTNRTANGNDEERPGIDYLNRLRPGHPREIVIRTNGEKQSAASGHHPDNLDTNDAIFLVFPAVSWRQSEGAGT